MSDIQATSKVTSPTSLSPTSQTSPPPALPTKPASADTLFAQLHSLRRLHQSLHTAHLPLFDRDSSLASSAPSSEAQQSRLHGMRQNIWKIMEQMEITMKQLE